MLDRDNTIMSKVELLRSPSWGRCCEPTVPSRSDARKGTCGRSGPPSPPSTAAALILAPEGTRNHDGVLQQGKPGMVSLALRADAWLQPVSI